MLLEPKGYYVYGYRRLDTGTWFYIGKGTKKRYKVKGHNESVEKLADELGKNFEIVIFIDNMDEQTAFDLEEEAIDTLVHKKGYGIDIKGYRKEGEKALLNRKWGGGTAINGIAYKVKGATLYNPPKLRKVKIIKNILTAWDFSQYKYYDNYTERKSIQEMLNEAGPSQLEELGKYFF